MPWASPDTYLAGHADVSSFACGGACDWDRRAGARSVLGRPARAAAVARGKAGSGKTNRTGVARPVSRPTAAAPLQDEPAPYDPDLERLSEILGALHFLRGLCNFNDGQKWRNEAQALIDAEAPAGNRHDEMIASFNRGYRGFQESYRTCTPAADVVIHRYLQEGARIARDITARYAN